MKWQNLFKLFKHVRLIFDNFLEEIIIENVPKHWLKKN